MHKSALAAGLSLVLASAALGGTEWRSRETHLPDGRTLSNRVAVVDGLEVINLPRVEVRDASGALQYSAGLPGAPMMVQAQRPPMTADGAMEAAVNALYDRDRSLVLGGPFARLATEPKMVGWARPNGEIVTAWSVPVPVGGSQATLLRVVVDAVSGAVLSRSPYFAEQILVTPTPTDGGGGGGGVIVTPTPRPSATPTATPAPTTYALHLNVNVFKTTDPDLKLGQYSAGTVDTAKALAPASETSNEYVQAVDGESGEPLAKANQDTNYLYTPNETPGFDVPQFDVCSAFYHTSRMASWMKNTRKVSNLPVITAMANTIFDLPNALGGVLEDGTGVVAFSNQGYFPLVQEEGGDAVPTYCQDLSKNADIIYHETTHVAYATLLPGETHYVGEAGGRNEGNSDFFTAVFSGDPVIGLDDFPVETHMRVLSGSEHEATRHLADPLFYPNNPYRDAFAKNTYFDPKTRLQIDGGSGLPTELQGIEVHHAGRLWGAMLWNAARRIGMDNTATDVINGLKITIPDSPFRGGVQAIYNAASSSRKNAWMGIFAAHGVSGQGVVTKDVYEDQGSLVFDEEENVDLFYVDPSTQKLTTGGPLLKIGKSSTTIPSTVVRSGDYPELAPVTQYYHINVPSGKKFSLTLRKGAGQVVKPLGGVIRGYTNATPDGSWQLEPIQALTAAADGSISLSKKKLKANAFSCYVVELYFDMWGDYTLQMKAK